MILGDIHQKFLEEFLWEGKLGFEQIDDGLVENLHVQERNKVIVVTNRVAKIHAHPNVPRMIVPILTL